MSNHNRPSDPPGDLSASAPAYAPRIRKRMSAASLLHDEHNRVLLVEPSYAPAWELPGGAVEPHESPWDAANRELAAKLAWWVQLERLLVVDYVSPQDQHLEDIAFVFDAGQIAERDQDRMRFDDGEVVSLGLHTVEEAKPKVTRLLGERIASALTALDRGATVVCEHGIPKI